MNFMDLIRSRYSVRAYRSNPVEQDKLDIVLEAELPLEEGRRRLQETVGQGFPVETPAQRGAQMEALIRNFGITLSMCSWQAVFIAVFLICAFLSFFSYILFLIIMHSITVSTADWKRPP